MKEDWQAYAALNNKTIEMITAIDSKGAIQNIHEGKNLFDGMQTDLDALIKINKDGSEQAAVDSSNIF